MGLPRVRHEWRDSAQNTATKLKANSSLLIVHLPLQGPQVNQLKPSLEKGLGHKLPFGNCGFLRTKRPPWKVLHREES